MPILNDEDQACLTSCMDEIRDVVGESVSERQLVDTIMKFKFDCAKSLDAILNHPTTPPTAKASSTSVPKQPIETGDPTFILNKLLAQDQNNNNNKKHARSPIFIFFSFFFFVFHIVVSFRIANNITCQCIALFLLRKVRLKSSLIIRSTEATGYLKWGL